MTFHILGKGTVPHNYLFMFQEYLEDIMNILEKEGTDVRSIFTTNTEVYTTCTICSTSTYAFDERVPVPVSIPEEEKRPDLASLLSNGAVNCSECKIISCAVSRIIRSC